MIHNFICVKCKKYKSHGKPRADGRYVCLDCEYKRGGRNGRGL